MAILIEGYSVVVRNSTVAAKYPGGLGSYQRDSPNATFCADDHLCRIGFMVQRDAEVFIANLAARGFTPHRDDQAEDIALVSVENESARSLRPCSWLNLGQEGGSAIAWLANTEAGNLCVPSGWTPDRRMQYLSAEEIRQRLEYVRSEDRIDVYRDKTTGKEVYVGRTTPTSRADKARHDELYRRGSSLIKDLILIHGQELGPLTAAQRKRLEEAIPLFSEVVRINPTNWAAMWLLGKVYQRLSDFESGLQWFARAHRVNPDQVDVAREASIAAMDAGRPEEAVTYCERALRVQPQDPGLQANLALALLFSGKPAEARGIAGEALRRDPGDAITAQMVTIIDEVLADTRPCPHHLRDLQG